MNSSEKPNSSPNPRFDTPNTDPDLHPACDSTLVEELGEFVDEARQIAVDIGARPYRIFVVRVAWSGGAVGRGSPRVVHEVELLPSPEIRETSGVRGEMRTGGLVERGQIRLEKISPRYTEDELFGLFGCRGLAAGEQIWIEARVDARDGDTHRRRFVVTGMPFRNALGFEWRVSLLRQDEDRSRSGQAPSGV